MDVQRPGMCLQLVHRDVGQYLKIESESALAEDHIQVSWNLQKGIEGYKIGPPAHLSLKQVSQQGGLSRMKELYVLTSLSLYMKLDYKQRKMRECMLAHFASTMFAASHKYIKLPFHLLTRTFMRVINVNWLQSTHF